MKNHTKQFIQSTAAIAVGGVAPQLVHAASLTNPLGTTDPDLIIANVIRVVLGVVGAISLVIIIYGGFMMMTSAGNQEKVDKGRKALMWAVIGLIVIFGSYGISTAIFSALSGGTI
jgi:hypothetical protein